MHLTKSNMILVGYIDSTWWRWTFQWTERKSNSCFREGCYGFTV